MSPPPKGTAAPGRYLVFRLADETYAIPILKVRELIGMLEITRVPGATPALRGVVNLRGKVISVIDLRARLGMGHSDVAQPVIIVIEHGREGAGSRTLGALVDEVLEVARFDEASLDGPPELSGDTLDPELIVGVARAGERLVLLLDIDRALDSGRASRDIAAPEVSP